MRASELLALRPSDIDKKREVITITNGKAGKERRVLLKSETLKELFPYAAQNSIGSEVRMFPLGDGSCTTSPASMGASRCDVSPSYAPS